MSLQNISQFFAPAFLSDLPLTKTLGEEFNLCENGQMVFHWADFHESCHLIKQQLEKNTLLLEDYKLREKALQRLSQVSVWIRTQKKVHQTSMYELYETFILKQAQLDSFIPLAISFISSNGPFKNMSIAECFNKSTYRDFVLVYLLQDKLPKRDFRIRVKSKVLFEHGHNFSQAELVSLEQINVNGLLFSMDADLYMKKFSQDVQIRMIINSGMLGSGFKSLGEVKEHLAPHALNLLYSSNKMDSMHCKMSDFSVQSSFDFSLNKKIFLFIPYAKITDSESHGVKKFQLFVNETRDLVREHFKKSILPASA